MRISRKGINKKIPDDTTNKSRLTLKSYVVLGLRLLMLMVDIFPGKVPKLYKPGFPTIS